MKKLLFVFAIGVAAIATTSCGNEDAESLEVSYAQAVELAHRGGHHGDSCRVDGFHKDSTKCTGDSLKFHRDSCQRDSSRFGDCDSLGHGNHFNDCDSTGHKGGGGNHGGGHKGGGK